jgi:hypothetical protein
MSRLFLVHWNAAEAAARAARLRRSGHVVTPFSDAGGGVALRRVREAPPEAFVIVLDRLPSHGRAVAQWVREQKATRHVPLVFVGGAPDKLEKVRTLLPDATYTTWTRLRADLARALRQPPEKPVVPGAMAAYSTTPLPRKLGIAADKRVAVLGAPKDFAATALGALPAGVELRTRARGTHDVVLLFTRAQADLERRFPTATRSVADGGRLWLVWPKKASGMASDLSESDVRAFGLARGWVDYKICAVDGTWSGLCFARRSG